VGQGQLVAQLWLFLLQFIDQILVRLSWNKHGAWHFVKKSRTYDPTAFPIPDLFLQLGNIIALQGVSFSIDRYFFKSNYIVVGFLSVTGFYNYVQNYNKVTILKTYLGMAHTETLDLSSFARIRCLCVNLQLL
jgi:hypothetical protein